MMLLGVFWMQKKKKEEEQSNNAESVESEIIGGWQVFFTKRGIRL